MKLEIKDQIRSLLREFESEGARIHPEEAESRYLNIVTPLLAEQGYWVERYGRTGKPDDGLDALAHRKKDDPSLPSSIGIEFVHLQSPVPAAKVEKLIQAAPINDVARVMLLSSNRFSASAREVALVTEPVRVELIDLENLKEWFGRVEVDTTIQVQMEVRTIVETMSDVLARKIAEDPSALDDLEWRLMEHTLARVFTGIGFNVTLTPESKDGGKDLILTVTVSGAARSYIVEVKHWRSGQRVGSKAVKDFVHVIAREARDGGLYLSTYGYASTAFEGLSEIERERLRYGDKEKIVALCRLYTRAASGIWLTPSKLAEVLFEQTV